MTKTKQLLYLFPPRCLLQIALVTITSVRNGAALVCTFLPDLLNWSSFDISKGNFRADAPKCDNGSSVLGNPVSPRSEKHGKPIKVWYWDSIQFWVSYQSNGLPSFVKKKNWIEISQEWAITVLSSIQTWEFYYLSSPAVYIKTSTARLIFWDKIWGVAFKQPVFINTSLGKKKETRVNFCVGIPNVLFNTYYKSVLGWFSKQKV